MQGANTSEVKNLEQKVAELTDTVKRYKENGALAVKRIKGLTAQKDALEKKLNTQQEAAGTQEVRLHL